MSTRGQTRARVPARVGLVGNPSDGFGGAVVAALVDEWAADVTVTPISDGLRIGNRSVGTVEWPSPGDAVADVATRGHPVDHEIASAALVALHSDLVGPLPPVAVEWASSIPRSVGLAGSSAIAVAVIEAVAASVGRRLDPRVTAALALEAETVGLGVPAGWQDRIVQASRSAVLVDAAEMSTVAGRAVPAVRSLPGLDIEAVVGWRPADSEDSATYHGALRRRVDREVVAAGMQELAALARRAADCAARGDVVELIELVDAGWLRRRACAPLRPTHEALVESVRATGVVATTPGSGGSVVAFPSSERSRGAVVGALDSVGSNAVVVRLR